MKTFQRFPITSFFVGAYIWTWFCWWSIALSRHSYVSMPVSEEFLATCGQFGPFVAAVLVIWTADGHDELRNLLARLVRCRAKPIWLGVSLALLPATMLLAILLVAAANGSVATLRFQGFWSTLPAHFVYLLLLGGPLGEEPGWSGFALPRLQAQCGPVWASIWLGLLRAGWHLPLWWIFPAPTAFPLYVVGVVLMQFLFTWLFNHTRGSVFYSLLFHTSLSLASVRLPEAPAYAVWVLCLLALAVLVLLYDRRLGLPISDGILPGAQAPVAPGHCALH